MSSAGTRRRRDPSRHHTLIGVVGALLAAVAVYVSFVANSGLPWVPTYDITVDVPDANRMIKSNQVRIGGVRVGQVTGVRAIPPASDDPDGRPISRLSVALDRGVPRIPVDSRVRIRPASVLGATYLAITPGDSRRTVPPGGGLAVTRASGTVQLTELFDMFDRRTAGHIQATIGELGAGIAGRGVDLGETVTNLADGAPRLTRVLGTLAAPSTRLAEFIREYEATFSVLAREHPTLGRLATDGARTMGALTDARTALGRTLDELPGTARATGGTLRRLRPALRDLADVSERLLPASRRLPAALDAVRATVDDGTPVVRRLPRLTGPLTTSLTSLEGFARRPSTEGAIRKLGDALTAGGPFLETLGAAQVHCKVLSLWGQNLFAGFGTMGQGPGAPYGPLMIKQLGTNISELFQNAEPHEELHVNYLPHLNEDECETGNEPFHPGRRSLTNPQGLQSDETIDTVPPPGVISRARRAGLLDTPPGG
ncbi:MAG: MlaD family protein [Solirubrobacteraceae bacterium]